MIYFHDLLGKLSDEEIDGLSTIAFTDVQRRIFDYLVSILHQELPSTKEIAAELDITPGHLRKSGSVILKRCYDYFAPDGPKALILFLAQHSLHAQVKHEIKKAETSYLKADNKVALSDLYFDSMSRLLSDDIANYDFEFLDHMINAYEKLNPENNAQQISMKLQRMCYEMTYTSTKPSVSVHEIEEFNGQFKSRLDEFNNQLANDDEPTAKFWRHYCYYEYYTLSRSEPEQRLAHILDAIEICKAHPNLFNDRIYLGMLCKIAMIYYDDSKLKQAYQYFHKIFTENAELMKGGRFYADMYAQCCISLGHYDAARDILLEYHYIDNNNIVGTMGNNFGPVTILALIDLLSDQYEDASVKIQAAKQKIDKSTYIILEGLLRAVDNCYFILTEDYGTSTELLMNNLKFCHYHKDKAAAAIFKQYFLVLRHFLQSVYDPKPLPEGLSAAYSMWQIGELAFAGKLLEKIHNKVLSD